MKYKTPTGRRKKSLLDVVYGKEFVDDVREQCEAKKKEEMKQRLKLVIKKCYTLSWGLKEDDFYELLIKNGVVINDNFEDD